MRLAGTVVAGLLALALVAAQRPVTNDPHFSQQWGLARIGAPEAWRTTRGDGVLVAIIDSGVDLTHPELDGQFARDPEGRVLGWDFVDDDAEPVDEHGHGTMVAGIVGARTSNGRGVASVAPAARLMPIRVLDRDAGGTSADVDAGIRWAVDHGADVINLSLEVAREENEAGDGPIPSLDDDTPESAVRYAWSRGVVVVAAAGNDASEFTDYPEDSPVVLVGASDRRDRPTGFSDSGRRDALLAPGVDIVSTWCNPCGAGAEHTIGQSEGTSYAAPHVAGVVALLRATGLGPEEAVRVVRESAVDLGEPGPDERTGYGRVDAAAAVAPAPAPQPNPSPQVSSPPPPSQRAAGDEPVPPPTATSSPPEPEPTPVATPPPTPPVPGEPPSTPDAPPRAAEEEEPVADDTTARWVIAAMVLLGLELVAVTWLRRRG